MRKLLWVLLLFMPSGAIAEGESQSKMDRICAEVHKTAAVIMESRQEGLGMPEMMEIAAGEPSVRALVLAAYKQPRFSTDKHQRRSVDDFANEAYLACVEVYSK